MIHMVPLVSVIIPAYNREQTIGRAIRSVLNQTFQDFEIIVVDDGSTDGAKAVVDGFGDPRIRYLHHERNRGAAAARNTGIRAARGEYLAFLDSDDEWLPEKTKLQIALLEDPALNADLSCTGFFLMSGNSEIVYRHASLPSWVKRLHWTCGLSPGSTLVVRRECVERVGLLDEQYPRLEDWDWLLKLAMGCKLEVIGEPLARVYRGRLPSADVVEASTVCFVDQHDPDFRAFGWYYRRRVVAKHWLGVAYWFYRERRFREGNGYLLKAFAVNPLQNPLRLMGLCVSILDALTGTSIMPWVLDRKQRLLKR